MSHALYIRRSDLRYKLSSSTMLRVGKCLFSTDYVRFRSVEGGSLTQPDRGAWDDREHHDPRRPRQERRARAGRAHRPEDGQRGQHRRPHGVRQDDAHQRHRDVRRRRHAVDAAGPDQRRAPATRVPPRPLEEPDRPDHAAHHVPQRPARRRVPRGARHRARRQRQAPRRHDRADHRLRQPAHRRAGRAGRAHDRAQRRPDARPAHRRRHRDLRHADRAARRGRERRHRPHPLSGAAPAAAQDLHLRHPRPAHRAAQRLPHRHRRGPHHEDPRHQRGRARAGDQGQQAGRRALASCARSCASARP